MYKLCMLLVAILLFAHLMVGTLAYAKTTSLKKKFFLNWVCIGLVVLILAWAIAAIAIGEGWLKLGGVLEVLIALVLGFGDISNIKLNSKRLAEENKTKEGM